ncbi:hypothetical protein Tco_0141765, partial [Tanacetum coccineum]
TRASTNDSWNTQFRTRAKSSFSTPYVPPINNDWDILFQPMFDELLNPPPSVVSLVPAAQRPANPTGSPVSTSIDQDASSSKPSVMPSARSQSTANGSKPKPRINNQKSRNWPACKSSSVTTKTVPIAENSRNS